MIKAVLFDWGQVLRSKTSGRRAKQVYMLAEELRGHGIKTGILSNIYSVFGKIIRLIGDYKKFDPIILSYEVGVRKPNPEIYRLAVEQAGVKPNEIIFVDNRTENIEAAEKVGMKTVLESDANRIVAGIKTILLKENGLKL